MIYADFLDRSWRARSQDQKVFNQWEKKMISTEECFRLYRENNRIVGKAPAYQKDLFEYWLNSLGYRRERYDEKE